MRAKEFIAYAVTYDQEDCLFWLFSTYKKGYGQLTVSRSKVRRAHRLVCSIVRGEPDGPHILCLHSCDNPGCVNPRHLRFGTAADNSAEMVKHGNSTRGRKNSNVKLTVRQVRQIRKFLLRGWSQTRIPAKFNVSRSAILGIHSRKNWSWLE